MTPGFASYGWPYPHADPGPGSTPFRPRVFSSPVLAPVALVFVHVFKSCHGGAAAGLVVLSGALPERPRVGTGPDHRVLGALGLPTRADGPGARWWPGWAHGRVLQRRTQVQVGVVPAAA
jgi:hypothetical protein